MLRIIVMVLLAAAPLMAQVEPIAGVINAYAPVVAIESCGHRVVVDDASAFAALDRVLIFQATGAVIDSTPTPAFGGVLDWAEAGHYEFATVRSVRGDTVELVERILRAYDPSLTQLIRVPRYRSAEIVGTVTALPWNKRTGGVVALEVLDTLVMSAGIDVRAQGLRGGHVVVRRERPLCNVTDYFVPDSLGTGGGKGEGIARRLWDPKYSGGRGAPANGGGGGNDHNAGGGGGGNGGAGGIGGHQWSGCDQLGTGGIGGAPVGSVAESTLLMMGGGGGSGHSNDHVGVIGGNGGGIVIVRARAIAGNARTIVADGEFPTQTSGNDGAGGGGAGGTVVLDIDMLLSPLKVSVRGGNGAYTSADLGCHGPGGGGGGGVVLLSTPEVPPTLDLALEPGEPGGVLNPILPCYGTSYGAERGAPGVVRTGVPIIEGHAYPTITLPQSEAAPGDTVEIAVRLLRVIDYAFRPLTSVRFDLTHDPRLLFPLDSDEPTAASVPGELIVTSVEADISRETDTVVTLRTIALLGHSSRAGISVVDPEFGPVYIRSCPPHGDLIAGAVAIEICEEGSDRLVRSASATTLKPIAPNPLSTTAAVAYTLSETGTTLLLLRDGRGGVVRTLFHGTAAAGSHSLQLDAGELPSGFYAVELVTPTERMSRTLHIVR